MKLMRLEVYPDFSEYALIKYLGIIATTPTTSGIQYKGCPKKSCYHNSEGSTSWDTTFLDHFGPFGHLWAILDHLCPFGAQVHVRHMPCIVDVVKAVSAWVRRAFGNIFKR